MRNVSQRRGGTSPLPTPVKAVSGANVLSCKKAALVTQPQEKSVDWFSSHDDLLGDGTQFRVDWLGLEVQCVANNRWKVKTESAGVSSLTSSSGHLYSSARTSGKKNCKFCIKWSYISL